MPIKLHHPLLAFLLALCALSPIAAVADVYESIDEEGISHYSDTANNNSYVLIVKSELPITDANPLNTASTINTSTDTLNPQTNTLAHTPQATPQLLAQIAQSAQNNQLDSALIHAVMHVESAYQTKAQSHKGAQGLMQLMPATANRLGVKNTYDSAQNIEGGAKYLKQLLTLFNNDISLTLAAYNAGENAVIKYGNRIPPYKETQAYVPKVMGVYRALVRERELGKLAM
jgi:soluble lytic murein transglycosylase-like protein